MSNEHGLPENWRERIKGKKVIFYNTGVAALLSGNEKHIEKINSVFDEFTKHPNVVLWWRPHPLELSTAQSMRPQLRDMYFDTRRRFLEEDIGILDESADVNRAIAVSDAYYGDYSSLIQLYRETGKPIMQAAVDEYEVNDVFPLLISDICFADGKIYGIMYNAYALVVLDETTFKAERLIKLEGECQGQPGLFGCIEHLCGKLIISPNRSNSAIIYDISSGISILRNIGEKNTPKSFALAASSDEVLMLCEKRGCSYRINDRAENMIEIPSFGISLSEPVFDKDTAYALRSCGNTLYKLDLTDGKAQAIYTGKDTDSFFAVNKSDDVFILTHTGRPIITFLDIRQNIRKDITASELIPDIDSITDPAFTSIFVHNGTAYIFSSIYDVILKADPVSCSLETVKGHGNISEKSKYLFIKKIEEKIYIYYALRSCFRIFDLEKCEITDKEICIPDDIKEGIKNIPIFGTEDRGSSDKNILLYENSDSGCGMLLSNFIRSTGLMKETEISGMKYKNSGKEIYEMCKQIVMGGQEDEKMRKMRHG